MKRTQDRDRAESTERTQVRDEAKSMKRTQAQATKRSGHLGIEELRFFQLWTDDPQARVGTRVRVGISPCMNRWAKSLLCLGDHVSPCWYQGNSPKGRIRRG